MQYDPIKRKLGKVFNSSPGLRKLFYKLLDLLLLRSWHIRKAIKSWEKTVQGPQQILDAGSGFGQYDYYLASRNKNWQVKGVDVKDEQIEDCNNFFGKTGLDNASFAVADLTKLEEKPETYNLVLCVDVMEHIEEDELVLRNFYTTLKPGGMLLISTPSDQGGSDVHHHDHENDGSHSFIDEHVRDGYGIEEIADKMKRAGFSKTDVHYQYGPPGKLSWKLSMKFPILMLNASYIFFIILPFYYLLTFPFALLLNWMDVSRKQKTGTGVVARAWK
ncbi:MAG: class I SAM-dependent methyltransferase [Bacteroidales bacterium]|nr:class I SAM-dependent methyltransferase [Bacteroidales bacterium]